MATWQAALPGTVVGDDKGNYQMRMAGQWQPMPKGSLIADEHGAYHFDTDAMTAATKAATPKAGAGDKAGAGAGDSGTASTSSGNPIMDTINDIVRAGSGVTQAATQGALNIPHLAAHGLYSLLTGGKTDPSIISSGILGPPTMGPEGQHLMQQLHSLASAATSGLPAANPAQAPGVHELNAPSDNPLVSNTQRVVGDVGDILPAAGLARSAVGGISALSKLGAGAAGAEVPPLGMVTGETNPIARNVAGSSARPAATAHNQAAADLHLPAQVGVPPGTPLGIPGPDGRLPLDVAKDAPNAVYKRVEQNLPTGPLHPNAAQMVNNVGANDMIVHSPDTQKLIDAQKQRLLSGDQSGSDVVGAQRALRFNGFRNKGSLDPEQGALGDAQLKMADALHEHMVQSLPPNANVSVEDLVNARKTLAQIHTLDDARVGNNLNMQTLAKFGRDNPGIMDGPMADVAGFADRNPHVTRLPGDEERFNPSGKLKDAAAVDIKNPQSWLQPFFGAGARASITNRPAVPVAGLASDLSERPLTALHTPGEVGPAPSRQEPLFHDPNTVQPIPEDPRPDIALTQPPGTVQGQPYQHQRPLSSPPAVGAPYQPPFGQGAPLRPVGTSGELSLDNSFGHTYNGRPANGDYAAVRAEGVPDGGMMRRPQSDAENNFPRLGEPTVRVNRGGSDEGSMSGGASPEAARRPPVNLIHFNGDTATQVIKDSNQIDSMTPPHGSIAIDTDTGKLVSSGTTPRNKVAGLLERWKAQHDQGGHIPLDQSF